MATTTNDEAKVARIEIKTLAARVSALEKRRGDDARAEGRALDKLIDRVETIEWLLAGGAAGVVEKLDEVRGRVGAKEFDALCSQVDALCSQVDATERRVDVCIDEVTMRLNRVVERYGARLRALEATMQLVAGRVGLEETAREFAREARQGEDGEGNEVRSWDPETWPEARALAREKAADEHRVREIVTGLAAAFAEDCRSRFVEACEEVGLLGREE